MLFITRKKISKGLSLIEASMVLAISAVVISGVLYYYQASKANLDQERVTEMFLVLGSKLQSLYSNQPSKNIPLLTESVARSVITAAYPELTTRKIKNRDGNNRTGVTSASIPGVYTLYGSDKFIPSTTTDLNGDLWEGISSPHFVIQYWFPEGYTTTEATNQCIYLVTKNWGTTVYGSQINGGGGTFILPTEISTGMKVISEKCNNSSGVTVFFKQ